MGWVLLQGGAEFGGAMADVDREAIRMAGGKNAGIRIIPAAAAPDRNHERAGRNGMEWFGRLGASNVRSLPLIDRESAEKSEIVQALRQARLVYLLGGFPAYLAATLKATRSWEAVQGAYGSGAVVAGSSAGAMVLCEYFYDPKADQVLPGLGLLPGVCVLPHHNAFGKRWARFLEERLPQMTMIGIDEETGILDDGEKRIWRVLGKGAVTVYAKGQATVFETGKRMML